MIRTLVILLALSAWFVPLRAVANCPMPVSGANDDVAQFFTAVTLATQQTQQGGEETLKATTAPSPSPFDLVYAFQSDISRLECAQSLVTPFQHSADDKIAKGAQLLGASLQTLHWGAQRMLRRVNALLAGKPAPEIQAVNDSAADALKQQDAMSNLALVATLSAMLVKGCDPGATICARLLLTPEQRKDLTDEWAGMAAPQNNDSIADVARAIVKMLRNPAFKSLPGTPKDR